MTNQLEAACLVAILGAGGVYLCLSRRFLRILFGFLLLSNAANLVLLAISGDPTGRSSGTVGAPGAATNAVDPLPQALILTAIVIGFAVAAYLTVLLYRLYTDRGGASLNSLYADPARGGAARTEKGRLHE
jgi:multicomponent Na+:H+ antiporter subunit C